MLQSVGSQRVSHDLATEKQTLSPSLSDCTSHIIFALFKSGIPTASYLASPPDVLVSLVAQLVKNPPAMQNTLVRFLGLQDPLEEAMATHSSILAWRIPLDRGAWWVIAHAIAKSWT